MYYIISKSDEELFHYGIPRRSGRYPYGSGERPFQSVSRKDYNRALKPKTGYPIYQGNNIAKKAYNKLLKSTSTLREYRRPESLMNERVIKKGTTIYRSTLDPKEGNKGSFYVSYLDVDRDRYKSDAYELTGNVNKSIYEKKMTLKEDLKIPSRDTVKNTVSDIISNNPDIAVNAMTDWFKVNADWDISTKDAEELAKKFQKRNINDDFSDVYATYTNAIPLNKNLKQEVVSRLEKQGYNAMVDESGVGTYAPNGVDPLLVFDSSKSLLNDSIRKVSKKESDDSWNRYAEWNRAARWNSKSNNWRLR